MTYALATNGYICLDLGGADVAPTPTAGAPTVTATVSAPAPAPAVGQTKPVVRVVVPTVKVKRT